MNQRPSHALATSRARGAGRHPALSATSAIAAAMVAGLFSASPAHAADECGPAVAGTVTCTAAGNPYPNGITYTPTGAFALTTTPDVAATNTLTVGSADDVQVTNNGSVAATAAVAKGLNISGADVTIDNAGTISTAGGGTSDPDTFEILVPPPTAVLVNATGTVDFTNTGTVATTGLTPTSTGAVGVNITSGGDVTINSSGAVRTTSTGIRVTSGGSISGSISNVTGALSNGPDNGVTLSAAGPVTLTASAIAGFGDGLNVTTTAGDMTVNASNVFGSNNGVVLESSGGAISVNYDADNATNPIKDRFIPSVTAHSSAGPVTINAGSIIGPFSFSSSITATSDTDSATVTVSKQLVGSIAASGGTTASVLVQSGVIADTASVALTAGTEAVLDNRGTIGIAANNTPTSVTGSAQTTTFNNSGTFFGNFTVSGENATVINSGQFKLGLNSAFNTTGVNTFINNGVVADQTVFNEQNVSFQPQSAAIAGNLTFRNNATIDLRNNVAGDILTIGNVATESVPAGTGTFVGGAASTLYLDVFQGGDASSTDRIVTTGPITGSTRVILNPLSGSPTLTGGLVFAQGGAGTSATAFTLSAATSGAGLLRYGITFNAANNSFALTATPGDTLARTLKINEGAQQLFYRSADTVNSHFAEIRDARYGGYATGGGRLWGTLYGQNSNRHDGQTITTFGLTNFANTAYQQNTFGGQIGLDAVGEAGRDGFTVGVTGGFQSSTLNFSGSADRTRFRVANAGVLVGFQTKGLFLNALGQFSYYWARARSDEASLDDRFTGNSYGGQVEGGYRFGADRFFLEPVATIAYVRTNLDNLQASQALSVDFGTYQGLRGKAGARVGSRIDLGGGAVVVAYAQGNYVHEFKGDHGVSIDDGDTPVILRNQKLRDFGEGKVGFSAGSAGGVTGFVEGFGTVGHDYRGGGGRAGIRVKL